MKACVDCVCFNICKLYLQECLLHMCVTVCIFSIPRYNLFIVLYPLGVIGELLTIYSALPVVRRSGMYSMRLPNKYNVSFDYYYCLIIVMLSYIPRKELFYTHTARYGKRCRGG